MTLPAARVLAAACLILGLFAAPVSAEPEPRPNIIVVLADDYGWGSVGCYGGTQARTPNLDRLAREGRRFTHAYAPGSVCSPSRYALLTGRYYWRTPIKDGKVLPGFSPLHIETDRQTVASICKSKGYRTGAFGKWHLGMTNDRVTDWSVPLKPGPLEIGFDYFFGMAANLGNGPHSFIENHGVIGRIPGEPILVTPGLEETTGTTGVARQWEKDRVMDTLTTQVCRWIESNRNEPFFVYYAPNAVHEPMVPHPRFSGSPLGKYGDFIEELDSSVGRILETLDRLKLADNTLVIFTSDNGGVVNPGNKNAQEAIRAGLAINGPLRGGKHSEWEGGFREPFLVRWPGRVPAGSVSDQVICHSDLAATLAALLNVPLAKGSAEDSFNALPALTEPKPGAQVRDHVILQSSDAVYTIRMGDWKLVERADAPTIASVRNARKAMRSERKRQAAPERDQLFNLRDDPAEAVDLSSSETQRVADMKKALRAARDRGFTRAAAAR